MDELGRNARLSQSDKMQWIPSDFSIPEDHRQVMHREFNQSTISLWVMTHQVNPLFQRCRNLDVDAGHLPGGDLQNQPGRWG